jgi:hypothetical protein
MFPYPVGNCNKRLHDEFCKRFSLLRLRHELLFWSVFLLVNYILLSKQFIISEFFHSIPPKLEYILMVRPWHGILRLLFNVYYHAKHPPRVLWKCAKYPLGFFNFFS